MGAIVGFGIGVGIIGVAAIAGVIMCFMSHVRRKHNAQQAPSPPYYDPKYTETSFKGYVDVRVAISWSCWLAVEFAILKYEL